MIRILRMRQACCHYYLANNATDLEPVGEDDIVKVYRFIENRQRIC